MDLCDPVTAQQGDTDQKVTSQVTPPLPSLCLESYEVAIK